LNVNKDSYLEYLRKANIGELDATNRLAGMELKIVQELILEGLLSDSKERFLAAVETNRTFITPKGAVTLGEWEKSIKENSIYYKFGAGLVRFLWVIVGVLASSLASLLNT
jgi:hypothetical protein